MRRRGRGSSFWGADGLLTGGNEADAPLRDLADDGAEFPAEGEDEVEDCREDPNNVGDSNRNDARRSCSDVDVGVEGLQDDASIS